MTEDVMPDASMPEIIDAWMQITTPRLAAQPWLSSILRWTGQTDEIAQTVETTLAAMDEVGISTGLISAWHGPEGALISNDETLANAEASGGRLKPVLSVDLRDPMGAAREVKRRAAEGFVGVRILPWLWELPPDDRKYYPVYAACIEAGIPFCTQIGHTGPLKTSEYGRLIPYLENVMLDFPELVVVGGHVGIPWTNEVASLMYKFPNFYVDTSAYALHRLPPDFVALMKGPGAKHILFGSNWPMLTPKQCLDGLDSLDLDDRQKELFLRENTRRVFKF
ncbi:MAG: amidohydrolase family protein [Pseudomonadota bacterium]